MATCAICLGGTDADADYHSACIEALFGTNTLPAIDVTRSELQEIAVDISGKMSISGVQEKISLKLSAGKRELLVATRNGQYILKPQSSSFAWLPENEHLTMRLAALVGIEVPTFGLVWLRDESPAYIVRRFDRTDGGGKLAVEDFCQLSGRPSRQKYSGSAELCVRTLRKYASEPLVQLRNLYRLLLFGWWAGNGDMHLKNFSLLTQPDGIRRLAPAYDLVCTRLALPNDSLALPVGGKEKNLTRRSWLDLAAYCELPEKAARRIVDEQIRALEPSLALIAHSFLPDQLKEQYAGVVRESTSILTA